MRRRPLVLAFVFLLSPLEVWAHEHRAGLAFMPRLADRSELRGVGFAFEHVLCKFRPPIKKKKDEEKQAAHGTKLRPCKEPSNFSVLTEASYVWGEHQGGDLSQFTAMVGGRVSETGFHATGRKDWLRFFGQALVGFVHENSHQSGNGNESRVFRSSFAAAAGAGMDIGDGHWALRLQADLIYSENTDLFPQYSAGLVWRFN